MTTTTPNNVVALLAEQNHEAIAGSKKLSGQNMGSEPLVVDEMRKKRVDREVASRLKNETGTIDLDSSGCAEVAAITGSASKNNHGNNKANEVKMRTYGGVLKIKPGAGKIARRKGKRDRKVGLELAPHRKVMGNMVQAKINVLGGPNQYGVAAECHLTVNCSLAVFRTVIVPYVARVIPKTFNKDTAVILAQAVNSSQITSMFGLAKVRVLRGCYSWVATKMDLVYSPSTGELRLWWVMST